MTRQTVLATLVCGLTALCFSGAWAGPASKWFDREPDHAWGELHSTRCHGSMRGLRMEAEELEQLNPTIKGKRLEVVDEAQGVWKYEFDIEAPGPRTQSLNHRILREIRSRADFPGYRQGEIPQHLMPEANKFVIEEIMNECLQTAMETYDLVGAKGDGSEADINTDIEDMLKAFKPGKPLSFCCTFDAKPKPKTDDGPVEDAALADTA